MKVKYIQVKRVYTYEASSDRAAAPKKMLGLHGSSRYLLSWLPSQLVWWIVNAWTVWIILLVGYSLRLSTSELSGHTFITMIRCTKVSVTMDPTLRDMSCAIFLNSSLCSLFLHNLYTCFGSCSPSDSQDTQKGHILGKFDTCDLFWPVLISGCG